MKILLDTEIDQYKWAYILENSPYASPFQTKKYYDFINAVQGFRAMAVAIEHQGRYCALAVVTLQKESGIKGYFSRRGIIYGGPVFDPQNSIALGVLLEHLYSILKKDVIYLETRNLFNYSSVEHIFEKLNWQYVPYINFQIETTDTDQVKSKLSNSRKRQIKNALQSGATWCVASNLNEVKEFYNILLHLYSQRIKKPLPSWGYFNQFFEMQIGKIIVIKYEGKVIGESYVPFLRTELYMNFIVAAWMINTNHNIQVYWLLGQQSSTPFKIIFQSSILWVQEKLMKRMASGNLRPDLAENW